MSSRRLSILYVMHVDWGWIRQRPHHLAEGLAARHDVEVIYPRSWRRSALVRNEASVARRPLLQLPLRRRLKWAAAADAGWKRLSIRRALAERAPDIVWITHPRLESLLPERLPDGTLLVYDCMDDAAAFPDTPVEARGVAEAELRLARRAAVAFVSSARLAAALSRRGFPPERLELLPNAAGGVPLERTAPEPLTPGAPLRAAYFGTIAPWLDFDGLLAALEAIPSLTVALVGPRETGVPSHPRLEAPGPVSHERLPALAAASDVLLVPFRRTPLVDAVDPVKVYEYVAFGRDIVCRRWPESEKFAPYATLYDTPAELIEALSALARGGPRQVADAAAREAFVRHNCWEARVEQVESALARARTEWSRAS